MNKSHGKSRTREYIIWSSMKLRCKNINNPCYKDYGGRGITYDPSWEKFENFWYDMGETYKNNLTLERIDNDKGYYKDNCKWACRKEQGRNRRTSVMITYKDATKCLSDWARFYNINRGTLYSRVIEMGWDFDKAVNVPVKTKKRKIVSGENA